MQARKMLTKLCSKCGRLMEFGSAMCPACQAKAAERHKMYDTHARNQKAKQFYHSKQWATMRNIAMIQASYQCEVCRKQGKLMPADEVHHIIPIAVDWSKRLDRANLICLCHKHHMEAHKKLEAGHGGG